MQSGLQESIGTQVPEANSPSLAFYLRAALGETQEALDHLYVRPDDAGLFQIFLESVPNTLSEILSNLTDLRAGQTTDVKSTYRAFHVLQAQWGFLGFYQMWQLCGAAANLLEPFLDGKRLPGDKQTESILKVLECFRAQAERIARGLSLEMIEIWDAESLHITLQRQVGELNDMLRGGQAIENLALAFMPTIQNDQFFKIQDEKMDEILALLSELTIAQSDLQNDTKGATLEGKGAIAISRAARTTKKLRDMLLSFRQVSIKPLFEQGSWAVKQYSMMFRKKIKLEIEGQQIQLDQSLLTALSWPLLQLLKNAVEHGIEPEAERLAAGKNAEGKLRLKATQKSGSFLLEVEDDGHGVDLDKLRKKGMALGILRDEKAPQSRVLEMIFKAGVTTMDGVEEGRGSGLDQVETLIEALHGSIRVQSRPGQGCKFVLKVPQSQSLIEGWVVESKQKRLILPISQVLKITPRTIPDGSGAVNEEEGFPVLDLGQWLGEGEKEEQPKFSIRVESGSRQFHVLVDEVLGEQQVLVKKKDDGKPQKPGILGEAVLSDGKVGLILDTGELVKFLEQNTQGGKA